ncbi:MAG TPA: hypothetical protein VFH45_07225 [Acidimicrobiales bacterium]|nr:hypothetical protein [Acidimicrobiales bacterium]
MPSGGFDEEGATVLRRASALARHSGVVTPAHLLAAVLEVSGPLGAVAAWAHGSPAPKADVDETVAPGATYDTLARQAIASAVAWAARRGTKAGAADLLVVLVDQESPPVANALARLGAEAHRLRPTALNALGLPADYGPVGLEPLPQATADRAALALSELPAEAWAELQERQERLPLHVIRHPSDWAAVSINERRAALRMAARRRLPDDAAYSLLHHHERAVRRLAAGAAPDLFREPEGERRAPGGRVTGRRRRALIPEGWIVWFGNRRIGVKVIWFRWTVQRY